MSDSINYNFSKLKSVFTDFYNVTGINVNLVNIDNQILRFNKIQHNEYCRYIQSTKEGRDACAWSDTCLVEKCRKSKRCEVNICHAGLVDVAVPLMYDDIILGYLIFGQMRTQNSTEPIEEKAREYFEKIPLTDIAVIESVRIIAEMLAKYILFEDMLKPEYNSLIQKATAYINNNLTGELTTDSISKGINVSKSTLYHNFNKFLKCTVSEYINIKRVEKSTEYLKNSDLAVEEISRLVGYTTPSYYGKIFKNIMGITPGTYRKNYEEQGGSEIVYYTQ